jgi:hypothetical protein
MTKSIVMIAITIFQKKSCGAKATLTDGENK